MPFGLSGAPFTLSAALGFVLKNCRDFTAAYYDDIILHSIDIEQHLHHLQCVLTTLAEYGHFVCDDKVPCSITAFTEKLEHMYDIARVHMGTRQQAYASYYDKRVLDDQLNVNDQVYVYFPRDKRVKLAKKWNGPYKVVDADHPVYKVQLNGKTGMQVKVFTRDKLKRVPTGFVQDVQTERSLHKEA